MLRLRVAVRVGRSTRALSVGWESIPEEDYTLFPRERPGNTYALNWSLADDDINPTGDAFHNLKDRSLIMQSSGKILASGAFAADKFTTGKSTTPSIINSADISIDDFEDEMAFLKDHLSAQKAIFVTDAAIGSSGGIRIRAVCEDATTGLFLKSLLVPAPPRGFEVQQAIKAFFANSLPGAKDPVVLQDTSGEGAPTFAAAGLNPGAALLEKLADFAAPAVVAGNDAAVALAADALLYPTDSTKLSLVVGLPPQFRAQTARANLYSAHHSAWCPAGVARLWQGAVLPADDASAKLQRGDLVLPSGEAVLSFPGNNMAPSPSVIAFVEEGAAAKDLSVADACQRAEQHLLAGDAAKFQALLESSGAKARVIGPADGPSALFQ